MTLLDTNALMQLLAEKCEVLTHMRKLVGRQYELIDSSDLNQLLNLLAEKQRLIGSLQVVQRKLDPYRAQSPQQREWQREDDRRRCTELADVCQRLLGEIVELENRSEHRLIVRRNEAASQLQAVNFAAQAREAYVEPHERGFSQVDLSSD